ncbi:hypothetical protein Agub_g9202 [Astrephomene gubernaculifera]|uniref:Cytochrome b5 heme-binding domain-containing protein n=1 Tax=Astrephomene gubernaculifera TaxID=47775 RepID=A0AAD3DT81_9CHLO|nr:hypothetical protein Agub_g9202 [Astrephomene gubernaculifera]
MERILTAQELKEYDGADPTKPVYIAVKGTVYDVSTSREFYGVGGPYEAFAGRECARALAIMKVDPSECNQNLTDCSEKQLKTLDDWIAKFNTKYPVVGKLRGKGAEVDMSPQELLGLRDTPFPTSVVVTLVVVLLLTCIGAYVLYIDMQEPQDPNVHTEL